MSFSSFLVGVLVGLIALVLAGWLWHRKKTQLEAEKAQIEADRDEQAESFVSTQHSRDRADLDREAETERRFSELRNSHRDTVQELENTHQQEIADLRTVHQEKIRDLKTTQNKDLEHVRSQLARGMQWEETSRLELARVCDVLGVNGFLATNVCFLAYDMDSRPYIHQIDHLIVSEQMLFVVEAKHWEGTIYHRELPSNGGNPLSIDALPMLQEVEPGERYVLRVKDNGSLFWLPKGKAREPVKQVQTQSINFRKYLTSTLGKNPGDTFNCVLYSHPNSTLAGGARQFGKYTWITQTRELADVLQRMEQQRSTTNRHPVDVEALHEVVWALGGDILGLGSYAEKWQSPIPLGYEREASESSQSK